MRIKGAVVAVTGASSGIGEATALAFARRGSRLALGARRLDRLNAVAQKCRERGSPDVSTRRLDVGRRSDATGFITSALRDHEHIDILVNNAGLGWMGRLHEMPEEKVDELIATNLAGVIATTQAVLPSMLERRRGVIINVASVVGFRAAPYSAVYSATKYAVVGLSHALRGELSGSGVKVCFVYPASTGTEFFAATEAPMGPQYSAAWVAGLIDHTIGEARRLRSPRLSGSGLPPGS